MDRIPTEPSTQEELFVFLKQVAPTLSEELLEQIIEANQANFTRCLTAVRSLIPQPQRPHDEILQEDLAKHNQTKRTLEQFRDELRAKIPDREKKILMIQLQLRGFNEVSPDGLTVLGWEESLNLITLDDLYRYLIKFEDSTFSWAIIEKLKNLDISGKDLDLAFDKKKIETVLELIRYVNLVGPGMWDWQYWIGCGLVMERKRWEQVLMKSIQKDNFKKLYSSCFPTTRHFEDEGQIFDLKDDLEKARKELQLLRQDLQDVEALYCHHNFSNPVDGEESLKKEEEKISIEQVGQWIKKHLLMSFDVRAIEVLEAQQIKSLADLRRNQNILEHSELFRPILMTPRFEAIDALKKLLDPKRRIDVCSAILQNVPVNFNGPVGLIGFSRQPKKEGASGTLETVSVKLLSEIDAESAQIRSAAQGRDLTLEERAKLQNLERRKTIVEQTAKMIIETQNAMMMKAIAR